MQTNFQNIIDSYISWIKDNTSIKMVGNGKVAEISTPFLDRHNDHLQIYVTKSPEGYTLTDDGYTLNDLRISGFDINSQKRDKIFKTILNGFGVKIGEHSDLLIDATNSNIGQKKHNLLQAILAVNDLHTLSTQNVYSLFKEDVENYFNSKDIFPSKDIKITGKTGFDHNIDFLLTATKVKPERLIRAINNPKKDAIFGAIFAFNDILEAREQKSDNFIIYNDIENPPTTDIIAALKNYSIIDVPWSKIDSHLPQFLSN